jgi:hypothetical protein
MTDHQERTLQVNDGVGGAGFIAIPREQLGELTPQGFALHAALLSYGWRGSCWPGMDRLGARTRMGEKALRAAKAELIEAGLLDETRRGQGKPNLYVVRTWDQRRAESAESRSSQTKVLNPPVGQHEVEEVEVEEVLSYERTTSSTSSEPFSEPSRPTSKTADSNGRRMVPPGDCMLNDGVRDLFAYWQEKCGHPNAKLTRDRQAKVAARLREGYTVPDISRAIDGAAKHAYVDDRGVRYDDLELICRSGSKLEGFIQRAGATRSAAAAPVSSAELAAAFDRGPSRSGL